MEVIVPQRGGQDNEPILEEAYRLGKRPPLMEFMKRPCEAVSEPVNIHGSVSLELSNRWILLWVRTAFLEHFNYMPAELHILTFGCWGIS